MREKKEFNFALQWEAGLAREAKLPLRRRTQALLWGIGSLLILGGIGISPLIWEYKLKSDIAQVEQKITPLGDVAKQVNQYKSLNDLASEQQLLLDLIQKSSRDPGPILDKLKNTLPVGTVVDLFSLQDKALTLGVSVPSPVDVARLWVSLRDSGLFQDVDIQTVSLQDKVQTLTLNLSLK